MLARWLPLFLVMQQGVCCVAFIVFVDRSGGGRGGLFALLYVNLLCFWKKEQSQIYDSLLIEQNVFFSFGERLSFLLVQSI